MSVKTNPSVMNHGCRGKVPLGVPTEFRRREEGNHRCDGRCDKRRHCACAPPAFVPAGVPPGSRRIRFGFGGGKKKGPTLSDRTFITWLLTLIFVFVEKFDERNDCDVMDTDGFFSDDCWTFRCDGDTFFNFGVDFLLYSHDFKILMI